MNGSPAFRLEQKFNPLTGTWDIVPTERYIREMIDREYAHRFIFDLDVSFVDDRRIARISTPSDRCVYIYSEVLDELIVEYIPPTVVDTMIFFRERSVGSVEIKAPLIVSNPYSRSDVDPDHACMIELNYGSAILYRMMKPDFNFFNAMVDHE